jgi:hypothetical protein
MMQSLQDMEREDADIARENRSAQRALEANFEMPKDILEGEHVMIGQHGIRGMILATVEDVRDTYLTVIIPGPKRLSDIRHIDDPIHNNQDRREGIQGYWTHTPATLKAQRDAIMVSERIANLERIVETLQIPLAPKPKKQVDPELAELRARAKELNIPKAHLLGKKKLQIALGDIDAA